MLDIDTATKPDRSLSRHSWGSDTPSSSSASALSGKEGKSSLWSKLRKQASRKHTTASATVEPRNAALSMDQPRPMTSPRHAGWTGNKGAPRTEETRVAQRPATAHSMDIPRHMMFRASTDIQPGASDSAGRPRLRRLLLGSADQGQRSHATMHAPEQHPAAGLARISEDDETTNAASAAPLFTHHYAATLRHPALRLDAKRFSENSGSSSDTVGDESQRLPPAVTTNAPLPLEKFIPSPTREHPPELPALSHSRAGKNVPSDPVVYRNTFFNARPQPEHQTLEAAIRGNPSVRRRASDETLDTLEGLTPPQGGRASGASVRFAGVSCVIPAQVSEHLSASMPSLARSASTRSGAKPRRPSEPTRPSTWRTVSAPLTPASSPLLPAPQNSPAAADAEYGRRMAAEVVALKRTVRTLQLQNDVLVEAAGVGPRAAEGLSPAAMRMRTLELENLWLRRELARLRARQGP